MMPVFNYKNQGRDATIDPAYLARIKNIEDSSEDITQLKRKVAELQQEVQRLQNQYNVISEQLDQATGEINNLTNQLVELANTINDLELQIAQLQAIIDSIDEFEPIDSDFINNLEPYNLQEGEG